MSPEPLVTTKCFHIVLAWAVALLWVLCGGLLFALLEGPGADLDLSSFRAAFESLTPGRRRGWVLNFSGAKQARTRTARIEKAAPKILAGKGMHDR